MSLEAGVLLSVTEEPIYWHVPNNRSSSALPDSRELWNKIWENKDKVLGFAHSHPLGIICPSQEDITTFSAIEIAIGKRLLWPILTKEVITYWQWNGPAKFNYHQIYISFSNKKWIYMLYNVSYSYRFLFAGLPPL